MPKPLPILWRFVKSLARLLAGLLATLLLILVLAVGIGLFLNARAERRAAEFCAGIAPSSPVAEAVARAAQAEIRHYATQDRTVEVFLFPGWIFNFAECRVEAPEGLVTRTTVIEARD